MLAVVVIDHNTQPGNPVAASSKQLPAGGAAKTGAGTASRGSHGTTTAGTSSSSLASHKGNGRVSTRAAGNATSSVGGSGAGARCGKLFHQPGVGCEPGSQPASPGPLRAVAETDLGPCQPWGRRYQGLRHPVDRGRLGFLRYAARSAHLLGHIAVRPISSGRVPQQHSGGGSAPGRVPRHRCVRKGSRPALGLCRVVQHGYVPRRPPGPGIDCLGAVHRRFMRRP